MKSLINMLKKNSWVLCIAGLIVFYKLIDNLFAIKEGLVSFLSLLTPFFIGLAIAYLIYPAVMRLLKLLQKTNWPWVEKSGYQFCVMSAYLGFIAIIGLLLYLGLPPLSDSLGDFLQRVPDYYRQIVNFLTSLAAPGGPLEKVDFSALQQNLTIENIASMLQLWDFSMYFNSLWALVSFITSLFMGLVVGAYFLLDKNAVMTRARQIFSLILSDSQLDACSLYIKKSNEIFYDFFYGITLEAIVVGVLAGIFFYFYGVPFAPVMAVIVTVFNVIPYFGPFVATAAVTLTMLLTCDISQAVTVCIFLIVLNQIDGMLIGPKILGNSLSMSPLWIILAILIGGGYFGILGMFLGIPVIAVFRMLLFDFLLAHPDGIQKDA